MDTKQIWVLIIILLAATQAFAAVKVIASSTDLATIAKEVGGDRIEVSSIAQGKSNLHFVEVLPSYMLKVSKADIYLMVGLSMDKWAYSIIDGSRNNKLEVVDCSKGIEVLEKPVGKVDASMGDVHPEGNPHYWLDPRNGKVIAKNILESLLKVDGANGDQYRLNYDSFCQRIDSAWLVWSSIAEQFRGTRIISYHRSWSYFAKAFGIEIVGYIEPKPGIEPTASHTAELVEVVNRLQAKIIFREPYFSEKTPKALARATGATVYTVPSSVGGVAEAVDYFSLFDTLMDVLAKGRNN